MFDWKPAAWSASVTATLRSRPAGDPFSNLDCRNMTLVDWNDGFHRRTHARALWRAPGRL